MIALFLIAALLGGAAGIGQWKIWRNATYRLWAFLEVWQGTFAIGLFGTAAFRSYKFGFWTGIGALFIGFAAGAITSALA